jgi:hypothetical protein
MSMWSSVILGDINKVDVATHSYNGLIRIAIMDEYDYEELTIDEAKNLIAKLERAITKQETPC